MGYNERMDETDAQRVKRKWLLLALVVWLGLLPLIYGGISWIRKKQFSGSKGEVVLAIPMTPKNYAGVGTLSEPKINLTISYEQSKLNQEFLVDSGATLSSLPLETAEELGINPVFLPRIALSGYGNTTSFGYQADVEVTIANQQLKLPVVFSDRQKSTALLGRKGFFENYSITFNHKNQTVEIWQ